MNSKNILNGKLRSNVKNVTSIGDKTVSHFALTLRNEGGSKQTVENIFLTGSIRNFAFENLKKGVIASVSFEYREHTWFDETKKVLRSEKKKFATLIKFFS